MAMFVVFNLFCCLSVAYSKVCGASSNLFQNKNRQLTVFESMQDAKVTMLGVVPSIVRAWKDKNCTTGLDWSSIR